MLTREGHRRGHGLRAASIQERANRVKELSRRGVKIRVSNQQRGREEGKGDFGVVVLFGEDEGGDDEGDVWRLK